MVDGLGHAERIEVRFRSADSECAGVLFLPPGAGSHTAHLPAVCLAPGLGWLKEMGLFEYAVALAGAGIAALAFDYRHYGQSGGQPREHLVPSAQIEDYREALTYLARRPEIDPQRLGIWGVSFSGGHVLQVAAYDRRVRAVAAVTPAVDVHAMVRGRLPPAVDERLVHRFAEERRRLQETGEHTYLPLAAVDRKHGALMGTVSHAWQERMQATLAPTFRNRITADSVERMFEHAPGLHIARISPTPLLMILASQDQEVPGDVVRAAFARAGEPKRMVEVDCDHYGVYDEATRAPIVAASVGFFREHL